jgi:hypothetical protein
MHASHALRKKAIPLLAGLALCLAAVQPAQAGGLSKADAEAVLMDTYTIRTYCDLSGEKDYAGKPENVLRAALFGAYSAFHGRLYEQESRKEEGKPPLPESQPVISAGGLSAGMDQFASSSDNPDFFKGRPEQCTAFISRRAAEAAALHYTGHVLEKHMSLPSGDEAFGAVLDDKGYCIDLEGLGDFFETLAIKKIEPAGEGYVLSGVVEPGPEEESSAPVNFKLVLTPGDKPGTWRRQYSDASGK